jgi:hypothetical protein
MVIFQVFLVEFCYLRKFFNKKLIKNVEECGEISLYCFYCLVLKEVYFFEERANLITFK